jgi:L-malate glycosyltransferase
MRLALLTPFAPPSVRGNAITVRRIADGLRARGVAVEVAALDQDDPAAVRARLFEARPDLVHAFHATQTGPLAAETARALGVPLVVTLTGTDGNQDLPSPARRAGVLAVLEAARALVVFHESMGRAVMREAPEQAAKLRVIPQGVDCAGPPFDLRGSLGLGPEAALLLQPAGLRRVKNIPAVLPSLAALARRHPHLRYLLAGPVLEADEAARVLPRLAESGWGRYLGSLPHEQLCGGLATVDVVINSSLSEGGMPNAVLEAMSRGVAVLVSDIAGNRSIVRDGEDGLLFGSEAQFMAQAERLLEDPVLRRALGRRAREKVLAEYPLRREIEGHLALYESLRAGGGGMGAWI